MTTYDPVNLTAEQKEANEREIARIKASPIAQAVHFLKDMRESGSWDVKTLNRAIEFIERIPDNAVNG